jgi:predicted lipase
MKGRERKRHTIYDYIALYLQDLQFGLAKPNYKMASCLNAGSELHHGFQETWDHTATEVLSQVQALLAKFPRSPILLTGHSLGAAVSTINYVWLRCKLPNVKVSAILFGSPRVGNAAFANSVDRLAARKGSGTFQYVVNGKDSVPLLPPRALGYRRPSGEIWIAKVRSRT